MGVMIQTAVLVTAILILRKLFREKLHAYIRYALWLTVVLRLLIPVNFIDSSFSILHVVNAAAGQYAETVYDNMRLTGQSEKSDLNDVTFTDQMEEGSTGDGIPDNQMPDDQMLQMTESVISEELTKSEETSKLGEMSKSGESVKSKESAKSIKWTAVIQSAKIGWNMQTNDFGIVEAVIRIFPIIWAVGSLTVGGFFGIAYFRFRRRLYKMRKCCRKKEIRAGTRNLYWRSGDSENNQGSFGHKTAIPVYRVDGLESPCLFGVIHPAVYIGSEIRPSSDDFRYAVTHEQVHYLHSDHVWALLRTVLVILYWFHPFVWIAAAASARDGEIACDYGTIRRLGDEERLAYGEMLLKLSRGNIGRKMYSYGTMLRPGRSEMKERILRLTEGSSRISAGILAVLLMLAVTGCAFTGDSRQNTKAETGEGAEEDIVSEKNSQAEDTPEDIRIIDEEEIAGNNSGSGNEKASEQNGEFNPEEDITEPRQLNAVPAAVWGETDLGVDGPSLDYAGGFGNGEVSNSIIIFHDYFGLIVYDLTEREILRSLDLASIGCNMTQGDNVCEIKVSADGTKIWLHPLSKRYMFRYEVEGNRLYQLPMVKTFELDLEGEDTFDRFLVTEESYDGWRSNYLYEEYKDEKGLHTAYIYLYVISEDVLRLCNLQCVWGDAKFILWDKTEAALNRNQEGFPYQYDGAVNDIGIRYDEPCEYSRISDSFGSRTNPVSGEVRVHEGIDYAAEAGTDVKAAADGVVYETGFSDEYGYYVVLLHQNGDMTYYCNCKTVSVTQDDQVERGDSIAKVGNTGRSTGAHLHFALSRDGIFVDPEKYM